MFVGVVITIVGLTDRIFLGRLTADSATNEVALGAHGLAFMWFLVFETVGTGLGAGAQVLIAHRLGEKRIQDLGRVVDQFLLLIFAVGLVLATLFWFTTPALFEANTSSPNVLKASLEYLEPRAFELAIGIPFWAFRGFYIGVARTQVFVFTGTLQAGANVFLNYVLIYGHYGFPELGIAGAGWASFWAQALGIAGILVHQAWFKYPKRFHYLRSFRPDWALQRKILKIASPVVLQHVLSIGVFYVFFKVLETFEDGEHKLALGNLLLGVYVLFMISTWGFNEAANTLVSNYLGREDERGAWKALKRALLSSGFLTSLLLLTFMIWPTTFLRPFTDDARLIAEATPLVPVLAMSLLLYAFGGVLLNTVNATGATRVAFVIEVATLVLFLSYLMLFPYRTENMVHAWLGESVYMGSMLIFSLLYLRSGHWRRYSLH